MRIKRVVRRQQGLTLCDEKPGAIRRFNVGNVLGATQKAGFV